MFVYTTVEIEISLLKDMAKWKVLFFVFCLHLFVHYSQGKLQLFEERCRTVVFRSPYLFLAKSNVLHCERIVTGLLLKRGHYFRHVRQCLKRADHY